MGISEHIKNYVKSLFSFNGRNKLYITILLVLLLVFAIVLYLRPFVAGADTYYYMNHACYGTPIDKPILSTLFFNIMPCNIWAWKLTQYLLFLISILLISVLGYLFNKEYGLLAGIFSFLGFALSYALLGNLEPQQLAQPLLILATIFIVLYLQRKKYLWLILATIFVTISCFVWSGSLIFLIILMFIYPYFFIIGLGLILYFFPYFLSLIYTILPNFAVFENLPFIAILYWMFLLIGVAQLIKIKGKIKWMFLLLFILGLLNAKYLILAVPLLSVGVMLYYAHAINNPEKYVKAISLIFFVIIIAIFTAVGVYNAIPTKGMMQDITTIHQYALDHNKIYENDWGLGYYSEYLSYKVKYKGHAEKYYDWNNSVVATYSGSYIDYDVSKICYKLSITNNLNSYLCK